MNEPRSPALSEPPSAAPIVLLVGSPNVGKSSLFNALTGGHARVGNYPGITVERLSGQARVPTNTGARSVRVTDVPGTHSLAARSRDERVALDSILGANGEPQPALVVCVVDATQLGRSSYLLLSVAELGVPLVVAVNMIDEARDAPPDVAELERALGVPCVVTDARRGRGVDALRATIARGLEDPRRCDLEIDYPPALVADREELRQHLPEPWRGDDRRERALALWALASLDEDDELDDAPRALREAAIRVRARHADRDLDREIATGRWAAIERLVSRVTRRDDPHPQKRRGTERADRLLLHPVWGFAIFVALMLALFQSLFSWSEPAIQLIESGVSALQGALRAALPAGLVRDFASEGVVGGVGNVIVFLPQILLLFLLLGLLEDSGYMARVAYLMDRVMRSLGLHGRAFVPMLSGFACAVPAILATRTMERQRDRTLTMLVIPLMTCSARLPVYTLIIAALLPPGEVLGLSVAPLALTSMYVLSMVVSLAAAGILGRTVVRGRRMPLLLELPPYRVPQPRAVLRMTWRRTMSFVREAGTTILACTVVLWALLTFPRSETAPVVAAAVPAAAAAAAAPAPATGAREPAAAPAIERTWGGKLGKALEPALEPLGFDWRIGVGLIGAFAAREVFVSTMALVYGLDEVDDEALPLRERLRLERRPDGTPRYRALTGISLMVFFAFAAQCMSTLATVRRETGGWRWPAFMLGYMTTLAWVASFLVYQVGTSLGF
ncbi:MAG: ferrous iron transport protein B [Polyangiaceae bacterium]|nr:ferrous iron transport protein B [Polyangiaceae bacterium]